MNALEQARSRVAEALERAAAAHDAGRYAELNACFETVDTPEVRFAGADGEAIGIALNFLDGWVDASNHDWLYYEGIERGDWPELARAIAASLREGRDLDLPRLARFDRRVAAATRIHTVTFGSMAGLVGVALVFLVAGGGAGLLSGSPRIAALSSLPVAWIAVTRLRLRICLTPDSVEYRGVFSTRTIRPADVTWAGWAAQRNWAASRLWGPFVYEMRTRRERLRVNLKLFSRECAADLTRLVPPTA